MTFVVGLTGGIGSGKSAVAAAFAAHAVDIADADLAAHRVTRPGEAGFDAVVAAFGREAVAADGTLDRAWLRRRVFGDADARARLEALLHPIIGAAIRAEMDDWRSPYGMLVVPLLLERGGLRAWIDRVLVVDCTEEQQVERVMRRSGLTADEVRAIMATQLGRGDRLAAADDVLDNTGSAEAIVPQVAALDRQYRALAATATRPRSRT